MAEKKEPDNPPEARLAEGGRKTKSPARGEARQGRPKNRFYQAIGRRKRATASVRLYQERGLLVVNDKPIEEYFPSESDKIAYLEPFQVTGTVGKFSAAVKVFGGGKGGQLGAVVLGFARALVEYNESYRKPLRQAGLLTRDPREKEPKKYFLRKARKRPQYSKR